jgi:hypothetical protein
MGVLIKETTSTTTHRRHRFSVAGLNVSTIILYDLFERSIDFMPATLRSPLLLFSFKTLSSTFIVKILVKSAGPSDDYKLSGIPFLTMFVLACLGAQRHQKKGTLVTYVVNGCLHN